MTPSQAIQTSYHTSTYPIVLQSVLQLQQSCIHSQARFFTTYFPTLREQANLLETALSQTIWARICPFACLSRFINAPCSIPLVRYNLAGVVCFDFLLCLRGLHAFASSCSIIHIITHIFLTLPEN